LNRDQAEDSQGASQQGGVNEAPIVVRISRGSREEDLPSERQHANDLILVGKRGDVKVDEQPRDLPGSQVGEGNSEEIDASCQKRSA
jgi:hypothetical protein